MLSGTARRTCSPNSPSCLAVNPLALGIPNIDTQHAPSPLTMKASGYLGHLIAASGRHAIPALHVAEVAGSGTLAAGSGPWAWCRASHGVRKEADVTPAGSAYAAVAGTFRVPATRGLPQVCVSARRLAVARYACTARRPSSATW